MPQKDKPFQTILVLLPLLAKRGDLLSLRAVKRERFGCGDTSRR
jgi:hypothetical protein